MPRRWLAADVAAPLLVGLLPVLQLLDANPYFKFKFGFDESLLALILVAFFVVPAMVLIAVSTFAHRTGRPGLRRISLGLAGLLYASQLYSTTLHSQPALVGLAIAVALLAGIGWVVWRAPAAATTGLAAACIVLVPYLMFQTVRHAWRIPRPPSEPLVAPAADPLPGDVILILLDGSVITTNYLDDTNYPDPKLLPNLRQFLQDDAHWFYNAVSNGPVTSVSLPTMLTGKLHPSRRNNYLANDETLFSILDSRVDTRAYLFTRSCLCYKQNFADCYPFQPRSPAEPMQMLGESWAFLSSFRLAALSFPIGRLNEGAYDREAFVSDFLSKVGEARERAGLFAIQLFDRSPEKLTAFDDFLGALFAALQRNGRYENATIALVSDHGFNVEGEDMIYGFDARQTRQLYRVPFAIKPPGLGRGTISGFPVQSIDLLPTILARVLPAEEFIARNYEGVDVLSEQPERAHYVSLRDVHHVYRAVDEGAETLKLIRVPMEDTRGPDGRVR